MRLTSKLDRYVPVSRNPSLMLIVFKSPVWAQSLETAAVVRDSRLPATNIRKILTKIVAVVAHQHTVVKDIVKRAIAMVIRYSLLMVPAAAITMRCCVVTILVPPLVAALRAIVEMGLITGQFSNIKGINSFCYKIDNHNVVLLATVKVVLVQIVQSPLLVPVQPQLLLLVVSVQMELVDIPCNTLAVEVILETAALVSNFFNKLSYIANAWVYQLLDFVERINILVSIYKAGKYFQHRESFSDINTVNRITVSAMMLSIMLQPHHHQQLLHQQHGRQLGPPNPQTTRQPSTAQEQQ